MDRPMCSLVVKGVYAYAGVIFVSLIVTSSLPLFFSRRDSVGQLLSAHETHPLFAQFCYINDSVGWFPVDHRLLVPRQHPQQQQPALLQYTLLQHFHSSK